MKIAVSACLLGENCKYSGGNNYNEKLHEFLKSHEITPICPEVMGGLPVPRPSAEIRNGVVINKEGKSVDQEFRKGAVIALQKCIENDVELIILQSRSPSCGVKEIYDGSFSKKKIKGMGVFARLASENHFRLLDIEDLEQVKLEEIERTSKMVRKKLTFHGHVQGVGFRYVSARKARELGLVGWVRNEYDGSVTMEVQGEEVKIDMLLQTLMNDRYIDISKMNARFLPVEEKYKGFGILY